MVSYEGHLKKMRAELNNNEAYYSLVLDNQQINLNKYLNDVQNTTKITIEFLDAINCIHCDRKITKSFNQGYCFPCFRSLAACDSCIMSPEKCHYHLGTCREPAWGEQHCMQGHVIYLANSSGVKVGLTRLNQVPIRWIDQGAVQALVIATVSTRYQAGLLEVLCKEYLNDRTNWQAMLKNNIKQEDLYQERDRLFKNIEEPLADLQVQFNNHQISWQHNEKIVEICYPVLEYPKKITSFNLDKHRKVEGHLKGIKGQYLILDTGVINIRKHTGYKVKIALV